MSKGPRQRLPVTKINTGIIYMEHTDDAVLMQ